MHKTFFIFFLTVILTACGFHLRGHVDMPAHLKTLHIEPDNPYDPSQRELRQALRLSDITVKSSPDGVYTLRLLGENYSKEDLIIGTDGLVKQQQLNLNWRYQLIKADGEALPEQTVSTQRDLNVNENQLLGQNQEERILLREMRTDLANQLLRRLATVPSS